MPLRDRCASYATKAWSGGTRTRSLATTCACRIIHAAIGRVQLRRLPGWTARRRRTPAYLTAALGGLPAPSLLPPQVARGARASVASVHGARPGPRPPRHGPRRHVACRQASTTRSPSTGSRHMGSTSICRPRTAPPHRCCPCRSIPPSRKRARPRRHRRCPGGDAVTRRSCEQASSDWARWVATMPVCCGPFLMSTWWLPWTSTTKLAASYRASRCSRRFRSCCAGASICASCHADDGPQGDRAPAGRVPGWPR